MSKMETSNATGSNACQAGMPLPSWFAAYTTPRHEKRIAQHLQLRNIEHFLPLYSVSRKWKDGSRVSVDFPLFPNYVFVNMVRSQKVRVLEIPGVLALAGARQQPAAVPDLYINSLKEAIRLKKAEPHPYLVVGETVRVTNGAMAGIEGILIRKKNEFRVVITLDMIFQSIAMEVDASDVEPVLPPKVLTQASA